MKDAENPGGCRAALPQEAAAALSLVVPRTPSWAVGVEASHWPPLQGRPPTGQALARTAWLQIRSQALTSFPTEAAPLTPESAPPWRY